MPSENSLRDELNPMCRCGHPLTNHGRNPERALCIGNRNLCRCAAFIPADAETAGEPDRKAEYERRLAEMCFGTTDEDEEEPEAPECLHESWEVTGEHRSPEGWVKSRVCASCREGLDNIIEAKPHWDIQSAEPEAPEHACKPGATLYYCPTAGELESDCHGGFDACCSNPEQHVQVSPAPPRPPFLVAYATGSGDVIELALPGEATAAVVNGALVICHPSNVLGIQRVKPLEM